jgi:hypothetical protein
MMPVTAIIGPVQNTGAEAIPLPAVPSPVPSLDRVREYIRASKAQNTLRGYQSDWRHFYGWCTPKGQSSLPATPETVASYIAGCADHLKVGSIQGRLNAIAEAHKAVGLESPTLFGCAVVAYIAYAIHECNLQPCAMP